MEMEFDKDPDYKYLLELIDSCYKAPINSYLLAQILMRKRHSLGNDVPKMVKIINEMLKDELIKLEPSTLNKGFGYVISKKGKELLIKLKD
jgi:hypothetical protein